jgi:hypothetical protein
MLLKCGKLGNRTEFWWRNALENIHLEDLEDDWLKIIGGYVMRIGCM